MDATLRAILREDAGAGPAVAEIASDTLAQRIRAVRKEKALTQAELALQNGLSHSALSKIENGHFSPTFETLLRLARGLGVDVSRLLASAESQPHRTRRVVTRQGTGERHDSGNYLYETLCTELTNKKMIPLVARIKARDVRQFDRLLSHPGEELIYVLDGEVEIHMEHYAPVRLGKGDCAYFDSTTGHACVSTGDHEATVFWVSTPS
jgi:transcriptional regulator with XRE-family HTH domain